MMRRATWNPFLRALDEFLVDRNAAQRGVEREEREEKRDGEDGESFDVGCEPSAVTIVAVLAVFQTR